MLKTHRFGWLLVILLAASFLRFHDLPDAPPGMTHDEADHGLDAWGVVEGERPLYFTVGYGREPLFDYSTAVLMSFLGPSYLAGRLTAVFFSLILIGATYAWARRAFDEQTALFTAAALAVSFWPLMVARHALRTVTMPALFALAVYFFWRGLEGAQGRPTAKLSALPPFIIAGLFLGLSFYTYMPARIMWLLFPALLLYLALLRRPLPWRGTLLMLLLMLLVAAPLLQYLQTNPAAEVRLGQLSGPLQAARELNFEPLFGNIKGSLLLFTFAGDNLWRYNVAGRPLLPWLTGILFYAGMGLALVCVVRALWQRHSSCPQAPALFLALAWLVGGLSPALVTGPSASMTRAAAMMPVLYIFPAVVLARIGTRLGRSRPARGLWPLAALLLFAVLFANSYQAYFDIWANHPQVRTQYEANLVSAVDYLDEQQPAAAAISTNEPNRFHDPATARMFLNPATRPPRWFDGRSSLLLPGNQESVLLFTEEAPLHPALVPYLSQATMTAPASGVSGYIIQPLSTLTHIYPQFNQQIHNLSTELSTDMSLGEAVSLLGYVIEPGRIEAGEMVRIATLWQVKKRPEADLVFFTHLLGAEGRPVAQADRLDVPSAFWVPGDRFIQLHEVIVPAELPAGEYPVQVGAYHQSDWRQRLPFMLDGAAAGDAIPLPPLRVGS